MGQYRSAGGRKPFACRKGIDRVCGLKFTHNGQGHCFVMLAKPAQSRGYDYVIKTIERAVGLPYGYIAPRLYQTIQKWADFMARLKLAKQCVPITDFHMLCHGRNVCGLTFTTSIDERFCHLRSGMDLSAAQVCCQSIFQQFQVVWIRIQHMPIVTCGCIEIAFNACLPRCKIRARIWISPYGGDQTDERGC